MRFLANRWLWLAVLLILLLAGGEFAYRELRAGRRLREARRLFEDAKYAEAIAQLDAVPQAKLTPELLTLRGRAHGRNGKPDAARADAERALQLDPRYADAYLLLGTAAFDQDQLSQAVDRYTEALQIDPKLKRGLFNRGVVYAELKKFPEAIADFTAAIQLDPNDFDPLLQRAIANLDSGNLPAALQDCNAAIELKELAGAVYLVRAAVQFELGEHALAEDDLFTARFLKTDLTWRELPFIGKASGHERIAPTPGGPTVRTVNLVLPAWPKPQIETLEDHSKEVRDVAYSADGKWLASVSYDSKTVLYDGQTLAKRATLVDLALPLRFALFSPDSSLLATGYAGNNLQLLDRVLAQGPNDTAIVLWDAAQGKRLRTLPGRYQWVSAMEFAASGKTIYAAHWRYLADRTHSGDLSIWDVATGAERQRLPLHQQGVDALAVSTDERWLAVGASAPKSDTGRKRSAAIQIWDLGTGRLIKELTHPWPAIESLTFEQQDTRLLASGGGLQRWRTVDWKPELTRRQPGDHFNAMIASPDGKTLATIDTYRGVCTLDAETGVFLGTLPSPGSPTAVAWSADGQRMAIAKKEAATAIHPLAFPPRHKALPAAATYKYPGLINAIAWRPGKRQAAIAGTAKTIDLVDFDEQGKVVSASQLVGHNTEVQSLVFSPDGAQLYSASGGQWDPHLQGELFAWDVDARRVRQSFTGFTKGVYSLSLDPSGKRLAAAHHEQPWRVWLWDVLSGQATAKLHCGHAPRHLAFSAEGTLAASALHEIRLWPQAKLASDLQNEPQAASVFKLKPFGTAGSLAWSANGELAVGDVATSTFMLEPGEGRVPVRWDGSLVQFSASGRGFTAGPPAVGEYALAWNRDGRPHAALIDNKLTTIQCLALSNEWGWLVAGRRDGSISLWDTSRMDGVDDAAP